MNESKSRCYRFGFSAAFPHCAVRWCHRFKLRIGGIENLLPRYGMSAARGFVSSWRIEQLIMRRCGQSEISRRAADEHGSRLGVLRQKHPDTAASKRFFKRAPRPHPMAATAGLPELSGAKHVFVSVPACAHDRAENSRQPMRRGARQIPHRDFLRDTRDFRDSRRTPGIFSRCGSTLQYFARLLDRMKAACRRAPIEARSFAWHDGAGVWFCHASQ